MDNLVTEQADGKSADCNDDDSDSTIHVVVDSIDELCANDGINGTPADTGQNVEDGDKLDSIPSEPKSGKDHLAETKSWTEGREVADW